MLFVRGPDAPSLTMPPRATRTRSKAAAAAAAPSAAAAAPAAAPASKPIEEEKQADKRMLPLVPPPTAPAAAAVAAGVDSDPDADPCAICLDDLNLAAGSDAEAAAASSPIASLDRCVHRFHASCISDWAKVTNLCPLCKTRFKAIRLLTPPAAGDNAPPARGARAGLRDHSAKVVRVATKNQCVTFSSEEEEEEEEEPAPRARRARRAAPEPEAEAERDTEMEQAEPAPRARRGRPAAARRAAPAVAAAAGAPAAVRSTRTRRRAASAATGDDDTEQEGAEDTLPGPSASESEPAAPDSSSMTDEEALAWALKASMVISTAEAEAANPARPSRPVAARRPRGRPAAAFAVAALAENKEAEEENSPAAAPKPRGRRRAAAPIHDAEERKEAAEATDSDATAKPAAAASSNVEWIRTRDGDWVRARTTGVTADSLMAQLRAQMAPAAAAAAAASATAAASSSTSSSSSAIASSIPKSRTTALSQANEALDSFEQRILQRKQMQMQMASENISHAPPMPRLFASAAIDLSAAIPAAAPLGPAVAAASSSLSAPFSTATFAAHSFSSDSVSASQYSSSAAHLSPPSPPSQIYAPRMRLSTTCDPSRGGLALIDAPGGLRIWKRRDSGFQSQSVQQHESKEEVEQEQQSSQEQSSQDSSVASEDDDQDEGDDENAGENAPSLWSRVTSYLVNAITPSKAPEAFAAPGGPCMEGQKQPIIEAHIHRQPLAARRLN